MHTPKLMQAIVADNRIHARWLNTLSYLEYIGFRKIVKSQEAETLSLQTLQHANEEGRHALLLKKLALKVGGESLDNYRADNLLCGKDAEAYFQEVDAGVYQLLGAEVEASALPRLTYLVVTWLVEVRALDVYGAYTAALAERGEASPLASLVKEEERHLRDVSEETSGLISDTLRERCMAIEERAYARYTVKLARALGSPLEGEARVH